jgi:heme a synthase
MKANASIKSSHLYLERWLWAVYGMVCLMIIVGGTTRLTGSGLSMVEWRPLMGTLPPLGDEEWRRVFEMYQASPQYLAVNAWMSMNDFKIIFFWEYIHRLIGRLIGLVFFLPMAVLWLKGHLRGNHRWRALTALCLGGLQGLLGWYMVKSGLVDIPAVSHYRLAAHLSLAFFLGAFVLWWILDLRAASLTESPRQPQRRLFSGLFITLLAVQIVYGAFVAGTRAGYMYTSFPLLNGSLIPQGAWLPPFGLHNLIENRELLNVIHRLMAILLGVLGAWLTIPLIRQRQTQRRRVRAAQVLLSVLIFQILLGILTVTLHVPVILGALHQITAFLLLSAAVWLHHTSSSADLNPNQPRTHAQASGAA